MRQSGGEIVCHLSPTEDVQLSFIVALDIHESSDRSCEGQRAKPAVTLQRPQRLKIKSIQEDESALLLVFEGFGR